ncbi:hypothetical protein CSIM01_10478 [Colletotrichum simmondsii]|uniref:CCHC-type domain-containing protein n=1 Tax=Colletotrichum simmondsii TaxID=703756 RepID=A0A135SQG2_9PEZI|nr:hypothetical protein CSIM01_10478 [Colletotrichum simmondsii]
MVSNEPPGNQNKVQPGMSEIPKSAGGLRPEHDTVSNTNGGFPIQNNPPIQPSVLREATALEPSLYMLPKSKPEFVTPFLGVKSAREHSETLWKTPGVDRYTDGIRIAVSTSKPQPRRTREADAMRNIHHRELTLEELEQIELDEEEAVEKDLREKELREKGTYSRTYNGYDKLTSRHAGQENFGRDEFSDQSAQADVGYGQCNSRSQGDSDGQEGRGVFSRDEGGRGDCPQRNETNQQSGSYQGNVQGSQGDRGGGTSRVDERVLDTGDETPRSEPPFYHKVPLTAQERDNIKTATTLVSLLRLHCDKAQCANCGHHGHRLIDCGFPDLNGNLSGCWLCNDKDHDWCECEHPLKRTLTWAQIYDACVGGRGGKPGFCLPFPIIEMVDKMRQQPHHNSLFRLQGPFPLTSKFVKKMLKGSVKDANNRAIKIWETYDYVSGEGPYADKRRVLISDPTTDTFEMLDASRDDHELEFSAPKSWMDPGGYFETDLEDSSATYGMYGPQNASLASAGGASTASGIERAVGTKRKTLSRGGSVQDNADSMEPAAKQARWE